MAAKKNDDVLVIPAIEKASTTITLVGDSPLIMHAWSEKAKKEMLDKQMKVAKTKGHDAKNPVEDFINSMYWLSNKPSDYTMEAFDEAIDEGATFGFPTTAFKASAVAGAYRAGVLKNKVSAYAAFHVIGEFAQIDGDAPVMREDMVRVGMGTADLRYRGEFDNWSTQLEVVFSPSMITIEQLVNLFNLGGFTCGVGEWRVEKGGSNGMYHVE